VLDEQAIPIHSAADAFGHPGGDREAETHVVLVRASDRTIALAVSRLVGQRELVTRPLPPEASSSAAVSGAAVLSDGDIVLLADCDDLTKPATPTTPVLREAA
jgi:two-component system chemotaxis sensor kinase CheA